MCVPVAWAVEKCHGSARRAYILRVAGVNGLMSTEDQSFATRLGWHPLSQLCSYSFGCSGHNLETTFSNPLLESTTVVKV